MFKLAQEDSIRSKMRYRASLRKRNMESILSLFKRNTKGNSGKSQSYEIQHSPDKALESSGFNGLSVLND